MTDSEFEKYREICELYNSLTNEFALSTVNNNINSDEEDKFTQKEHILSMVSSLIGTASRMCGAVYLSHGDPIPDKAINSMLSLITQECEDLNEKFLKNGTKKP